MSTPQDWFEHDYYADLGVAPTSTAKEITTAYRKLAKAHHPDTNAGGDAKFKQISAAYDVLGDATKRAEYDEVRLAVAERAASSARQASTYSNFGSSGFPGTTFSPEDLGDFSDLSGLFGDLFSGGAQRAASWDAPQRGADATADLHLTFEEAIHGAMTSVNVTADVACTDCNSTGVDPVTNRPCTTCGGPGRLRRTRPTQVRIPAGVTDGQRVRVTGGGAVGRSGGPPGDLFVVTHVGKHAFFARSKANLTITVPIGFTEAALGTTITVPTLDDPVTLRIPAGTPSGRTFRAKGHGVPGTAKKPAGDLLVTVQVDVPPKLSAKQREAVEALAATLDPPSHTPVAN